MKMILVILSLLTGFSGAAMAEQQLTCRTTTQIDGWVGYEKTDYVYLNAYVDAGNITGATIYGAYNADTAYPLRLDDAYKPKAAAYQNFQRYGTLEDAWSWYMPLFPKGFETRKTPFRAYIQVFGEEEYKMTLTMTCKLN
jgi:hypothetical protein